MNALLQIFIGSKVFMKYIDSLWANIALDPKDQNSIITMYLLELLTDMQTSGVEGCPR